MREGMLPLLRCPGCGADGRFALSGAVRDDREVVRGELRCGGCGHAGRVVDGIVDAGVALPPVVEREAAGLERFAEVMRHDGWGSDAILELPYRQEGYWFHQALGMDQFLATVRPAPGARILDVGSNTCWASALLAGRGHEVVALDISTNDLQGLGTARRWFDGKGVHFERVLATMTHPPLASASFDCVWACEVLHHTDPAGIDRTLRELHRVLKPGGVLGVLNEPLRSLRRPGFSTGDGAVSDPDAYDGYEHTYVRARYVRAARRAGFEVDVLGPWHLHPFNEDSLSIRPTAPTREGFKLAAAHAVRRRARLRRAYLAYKSYVGGGVSLHMVARKPG